MTDEELIARLRDWPYQGETMAGEAADRIEALVKAVGILEDALGEVGDECPGSDMQEWCQQQIRFAHYALKGADHV